MTANMSFLKSLTEFDKSKLNDEIIDLLEPYFRMSDYTEENARRAGSVSGLLKWTVKMKEYFYVYKKVAPLQDRLFIEQKKLKKAQDDLAVVQAKFDEKQAAVNEAQLVYKASLAEKQALVNEAEKSRRKIETAGALISGLEEEKLRWTEQSKDFKNQIGRLVGDVFICAGFLSYQGPFNQEYRATMTKDWQKLLKDCKISFTPTFKVADYLTNSTMVTISHSHSDSFT